jgi:hypothetical protein
MSLQVDGVWKGGIWAATVWADGVWREGPPVFDTPDCFTALTSLIDPYEAITGLIDDNAIAATGLVKEFTARAGLIDDSIIVLSGLIDSSGLNVNSGMQPTFGINGTLCDCE